jgi:hypothetical protein
MSAEQLRRRLWKAVRRLLEIGEQSAIPAGIAE